MNPRFAESVVTAASTHPLTSVELRSFMSLIAKSSRYCDTSCPSTGPPLIPARQPSASTVRMKWLLYLDIVSLDERFKFLL